MTSNDKWGSEWPVVDPIKENWVTDKFNLSNNWTAEAGHDHTPFPSVGPSENMIWTDPSAWPKGIAVAIRQSGKTNYNVKTELKPQGSNLVDDQAYLYFQCEDCNKILDPHTKSFQTLQEYRVNAGWKCVWNMNGQGYKVYCAECGEKV